MTTSMSNGAVTIPAELRRLARLGLWTGPTSGVCPGYLQANLVVLAREEADEFLGFCRANPKPLPLVEVTPAGIPDRLAVAPAADLRTDLPRYRVYRHGELAGEAGDITSLWMEEAVGFLLGCSFSAEAALIRAGIRLRHLELRQNVAMYRTSVECQPVGRFHGPMVVSMRPIRADQADRVIEVTGCYPLAHGAPVHVGDPAALGVADLGAPDWGDPIELGSGEEPAFWACGVTPQAVITTVRPEWAITHAPGHMFVTDVPEERVREVAPPLWSAPGAPASSGPSARG